jgi:hypothetical protein
MNLKSSTARNRKRRLKASLMIACVFVLMGVNAAHRPWAMDAADAPPLSAFTHAGHGDHSILDSQSSESPTPPPEHRSAKHGCEICMTVQSATTLTPPASIVDTQPLIACASDGIIPTSSLPRTSLSHRPGLARAPPLFA